MKNKQVKKLVRKYVKWWVHWLGLGYGEVNIFFDEVIEDATCPNVAGKIWTDWRYQVSSVRFSLAQLREYSDGAIEQVVVHELMHVFLNETRKEGIDHEERVATQLQKAFIWVRDADDKPNSKPTK